MKFLSCSDTLKRCAISTSSFLSLFEAPRWLLRSGIEVDNTRSSSLESASGFGGDVK